MSGRKGAGQPSKRSHAVLRQKVLASQPSLMHYVRAEASWTDFPGILRRMVVSSFVKMRRRGNIRTLAFVLLASLSALNLTPVCGSALDVDAGKCCERRVCPGTSAAGDHVAKSRGHSGSQDSCCAPTAMNSSAPGNADQCCERGRLNFPTIRPQSSGGGP